MILLTLNLYTRRDGLLEGTLAVPGALDPLWRFGPIDREQLEHQLAGRGRVRVLLDGELLELAA